jgi:beta-N-acetylhexosaminidase
VTLNLPRKSLRAVDEVPYQSAISAGVRLVMVSWATYPALDSRRPAGLSSTVIQGELRRRLKFTGVTITDALGAGALRAFGAIPNRAVLAARAGMDLLLCAAQNAGEGGDAMHGLAAALRTGRLKLAAFVASIKQIMGLRSSLIA